MALRDLLGYVLRKYPHKDELTKGRLTKIIYLIDWENAVKHGRQVTKINWHFDHYGPFVHDVYNLAVSDDSFSIRNRTNGFGSSVEVIGLSAAGGFDRLDAETRAVVDDVIEKVKPMTWTRFISYVYGTYPIETVERYNDLPLADLARRMKRERRHGAAT